MCMKGRPGRGPQLRWPLVGRQVTCCTRRQRSRRQRRHLRAHTSPHRRSAACAGIQSSELRYNMLFEKVLE